MMHQGWLIFDGNVNIHLKQAVQLLSIYLKKNTLFML